MESCWKGWRTTRHKSGHRQQRREDHKGAFLFHNCLQSVCPLWATGKKKMFPGHMADHFSLLFVLYSEKEAPSQSTHQSSVMNLCHMIESLWLPQRKQIENINISKYLLLWENLFLLSMCKMWTFYTFSQIMSLISYREWATTKKLLSLSGKNKSYFIY